MTGGEIAAGLNHVKQRPSVMTGGEIAGGLNHAIQQRAGAGGAHPSALITL
jgi:hypothetical protein